MDYTKEIEELYNSSELYKIVPFQIEIINRVLNNISNSKRMQSILLPPGCGKTTMIGFLYILLSQKGYKIAIYNGEFKEYSYDCFFSKFKNLLINKPLMLDCDSIIKNSNIDIIITDALSDDNIYYKDNSKTASIIETTFKLNDKLSIISFERGDSALSNNYTPILSSDYITFLEIDSLKPNQIESIVSEHLISYNKLLEIKLANILKNIDNEDTCKDISVINQKLCPLESKIYALNNEKNNLEKEISNLNDLKNNLLSEINELLSDRKSFMDRYFAIHSKKDKEFEKMISLFIDSTSTLITNKSNSLDSVNEYKRMELSLRNQFGESNWGKLSSKSKKFLTTAKFTLYQQIDLEEYTDYSGICVLASKAFEVELAERFINGYKRFLKNELNDSIDYINDWPSAIINTKTPIHLKETNEFTLGDCSYLFGLKGNNTLKLKNSEYFIRYCKNSLLKIENESEIIGKLNVYKKMIDKIRNNFRNPASHKNQIELSLAKECMDYIVDIEKVLCIFLNDFQF